MTRAKALKEYFKKFYNLDLSGMSQVAVLRDFLKKKHNHDAEANTYCGVLQEMVDNDLGPDGGGGSSDFSIATVQFTFDTQAMIHMPTVISDVPGTDDGSYPFIIPEDGTYKIILYKGVAYGVSMTADVGIVVTGDIDVVQDTSIVVRGNGTIAINHQDK